MDKNVSEQVPVLATHLLIIDGSPIKSNQLAPEIMCFSVALDSQISSTADKFLEIGHMIQGLCQSIRGPIQRRFGPSCVHQVYFLRNYKDFHDIWMECQIIKTSNSFLTLLLIYHQPISISWSIATQLLPNRSPVC